ncbi:MAG: 4-deoxy-4-formamido-L-arabinose-phosphoundecaprenol deformylase [Synergistaceae bacterium]|nr:4-deoxy-4-formamido-L-arabinose-phosphoundecaprenol deformylase [Synergistaceae bacterium]
MNREATIKVDVDTLNGYTSGVSRILSILAKRKIKASFFFSMGPDNSGKAIRRVFRKGFLSKMLRTRAPSAYGFKTMFYGTLLRAPMIVRSNPDILRRASDEGHDCGIHCWDHVLWQDCLYGMTREEIRAEFSKAIELFSGVTGYVPRSCAAPGWQASFDSLAVQDELGFGHCSDTRGVTPFLPCMNGAAFRTLQIPTTLPTLDEVWGVGGLNSENASEMYFGLLKPGLNVHTVHAEMEGGSMSDVFASFLDRCASEGVGFFTLSEVAARLARSPDVKIADIEMGKIPGRAGRVAIQK